MKKIFVLVASLFLCTLFANAQNNVIDNELQKILNQKGNDYIDVNIMLKAQMTSDDFAVLNCKSDSKEVRREIVTNELKKFAEQSQKDVMALIQAEERNSCVIDIKSYWLTNFISCKAKRDVIYQLASHPDIAYISYNQEMKVVSDVTSEATTRSSNAVVAEHLTRINADKVWDLGYTGKGIIVAVLDSGVNTDHADIKDHLWNGNAQHGYNVVNPGSNPIDDRSHGTHCAGLVCGDGTSGQITGSAPDATLMSIKLYDAYSGLTIDRLTTGIQFAVDNHADILSISQGWINASSANRVTLRNTFKNLLDLGIVAAVAAGNDRNDLGTYPVPGNVRTPGDCPPPWLHPDQQANAGGLTSVISVGALDKTTDNVMTASSKGPVTWQGTSFNDYPYNPGIGLIRPDIAAPGHLIQSLDNETNNGYTTKSGTSMATPCVAGVMALMLEKNPDLTPADLCRIIETTAKKLTANKSNDTGSGLIDALAAVQAVNFNEPVVLNPYAFTKTLNAGSNLNLELTLINNGSGSTNGNTTVTISENDTYTTIDEGSKTYSTMAAGGTASATFVVSVDALAPDNHEVTFTVNAGTRTFDIVVTISNEFVAPNVIATASGTDINLTWNATNNATSYNIYRDGAFLANTTSTSYTDTGLEYGTIYAYTVTSKRGELESEHSLTARAQTEDNPDKPSPTNVVATNNTTNINVTWTNGANSKGSNIYRKNLPSGDETQLATNVNGTSYTDNNWNSLQNGTYQYGVSNTYALNEDIYIEGFESTSVTEDADVYTSSNAIWYKYNEGSSNQYWWNISTSITSSGRTDESFSGKAVFITSTYNNSSYLSYLVSPKFNYTQHNGSDVKLSFRYITPAWGNDINTLKVMVSTTSYNSGWTELWSSNKTDIQSWPEQVVDLSAYVGQEFYIAFVNVAGYGYCTGIDEVSISVEGNSESRIEWSETLYKGVNIFVNDGLWSNTDNWSAKRLPTENDDEVYIDANAIIATGDVVVNSLIINEGGSLTLNEGTTLTVNDDFKNTDPDAFIINDGAQVFQNNDDVAATFNMNMHNPLSWGADGTDHDGGWQFIASPVKNARIEDFIPNNSDYDLYKYVGTNILEWVNQKNEGENEEEIIIGDGNDGSEGLVPTNTNYNYTLSQQIYTADELGNKSGLITSYSFKKFDEITYNSNIVSVTRNFEIYILNTDKESFNSESDWVDVSSGTKVFSGNVAYESKDNWTTIIFDTPFEYKKDKNIVISINDITGSYTPTAVPYYQVTTNDYRSIVKYSDNNKFNSLIPTNGTGSTSDNNLKNYVALAKFNIIPTESDPETPSIDISTLESTFYYPFNDGDTTGLNIFRGNSSTWIPFWQITPETGYYANRGKDGTKGIYSMSHNEISHSNYDNIDNRIVTRNAYRITENSKLSWWVSNTETNMVSLDKYKVIISEDGINFTEIWNGPFNKLNEIVEISLSAYAGKGLYIGFCHYTDPGIYGSAIVLDELCLSDGTGGGENEAPMTPSNLTATATGFSTIALTWKFSKGAESYNIYQDGIQIATGITETSFEVIGLAESTKYCFTVSASNAHGESGQSVEACATTDKGPQKEFYYPFNDGDFSDWNTDMTVGLSTAPDWQITPETGVYANIGKDGTKAIYSMSYSEEGNGHSYVAENYVITNDAYLITNDSKLSWWVDHTDANMTGHIDRYKVLISEDGTNFDEIWDGIYDKTNHEMKVSLSAYAGKEVYIGYCHYGSNGGAIVLDELRLSITDDGKAVIPYNLSATATSPSTIELTWDAVDGATSYNVYQTGEFGNSIQIATGLTGLNHEVTGLTELTEYCFTVSSVNANGESGKSTEACTTTLKTELPKCVIEFLLTDQYEDGWNGNHLDVSYDGNTEQFTVGQGQQTANYTLEIEKGTTVSVTYTKGDGQYTYPTENSFVIQYESGEVIYSKAQGDLKNTTFIGNFVVDCTPMAPKTPVVTAEAISSTEIALTWNNVSGATNYNVYQGGNKITTVSETSYNITGLTANTEYCFTVTAVNVVGESEASEEVCKKTLLATPTNLLAEANGENSIILTWDAVAGATSYKIYSGETVIATVTETTYTKELLIANTEYCYSVSAVNDDNVSAKTTTACATTDEIAPEDLCSIIFTLGDTYGDGWSEDKIVVSYNGYTENLTFKVDLGSPKVYSKEYILSIKKGTHVTVTYQASANYSFPSEESLVIKYEGDTEEIYSIGTMTNGCNYEFDVDCSSETPDDPIAPAGPTTFFDDFNDGNLDDFNLIDADGDGNNWGIENGILISFSWKSGVGAMSPNNYIYTKEAYYITETSKLTYKVKGVTSAPDHYAVVVSEDGENFDIVFEENNAFKEFTEKPVELGAYAGKMLYIGFRHFNCSDKYSVQIDDFQLTDGSAKSVAPSGKKIDIKGGFEKVNGFSSFGTELSQFETTFEQGRGYMASYENETMATFKGILNHEKDFTYTASYHNKFTANFFLFGNPFSFDMDWDKVSVSNMIDGYAMVNPDGSYSYYVDGKIKVGDGFFARSIAENPTISYSETRNKKDNNFINITAKGNFGNDNVIINLNDKNDGFPKIENFNKKIANIYVNHNDIDYGIYNYSSDTKEIELHFEAVQIGKYTISIESKGMFDYIILVDRFSGTETNMLHSDYSFTASSQDESNRFLLKLSANNDIENNQDNFVYQSGEELIINAEGTLQIIDIMGRVVYTRDANKNDRINVSLLKKAAYIVRCIGTDKVKTQKIVIL